MEKKVDVPVLKVRKGASLAEIYEKAREQFTAEELQKFTETDEGIPAEQVLAEMESIHREVLKEKRNSIKKSS